MLAGWKLRPVYFKVKSVYTSRQRAHLCTQQKHTWREKYPSLHALEKWFKKTDTTLSPTGPTIGGVPNYVGVLILVFMVGSGLYLWSPKDDKRDKVAERKDPELQRKVDNLSKTMYVLQYHKIISRTSSEAKTEALKYIEEENWDAALSFCLVHYHLEPKDPQMVFWLARCYEELGRPETASRYWKEATLLLTGSDAFSHYCLGYMFENGKCVQPDIVSAVEHYTVASKLGLTEATTALGLHYLQGGVPGKTYDDAIDCLLCSAEKGDPTAQATLGYLFYLCNPESTKLTKVTVDTFLESSIEKGNLLAKSVQLWAKGQFDAAARVVGSVHPVKGPLAQSLVIQYMLQNKKKLPKEKSLEFANLVKEGNPVCLMLQASMYLKEKEFTKARKILEELEKKGDKRSLVHLGIMYAGGYGGAQDDAKAVEYFQRSGDQLALDCWEFLKSNGRAGPKQKSDHVYVADKKQLEKTLSGKGLSFSNL